MDLKTLNKIDEIFNQEETNPKTQPEASVVERETLRPTPEVKDRRSETSRINGLKGGRPPKDHVGLKQFAEDFLESTGFHYRHYRGEWFRFNGKFYEQITKDDITNSVVNYIHQHPDQGISPVHTDVNNLMLNIKSLGAVESLHSMPCMLTTENNEAPDDMEHWLILQNTIANITKLAQSLNGADIPQEQIFMPHTPELFSTIAVNYDYDAAAQCPMFMKYLEEVQPEQQDRDILQMMYGLSMIPDTSYEVIFILYGQGGTGKSVCLEILRELVSSRNICCLPLAKFSETHEVHQLTENLLNIVGDLPTSSGQASLHHIEGVLKDVASGGLLSANKKFKEPYHAKATARNIFATNSLPTFADRSNGIWDRLRIIPFDQIFRGTDNQNPHLAKDIIENEMPGIFNWAIEGLAKLKAQRLFPHSERGVQLAAEHRNNCDHEGTFIRDNLTEAPESHLVADIVYADYQRFCRENGYRPKNNANFYNALRNHFPQIDKERKNLSGDELTSIQNRLRDLGINQVSSSNDRPRRKFQIITGINYLPD